MSSQNLLHRALLVFAFAAMPAAPAAAQVAAPPDAVPEFVPYVNDLQVFDQPDLSTYGRGTRAPTGYFGSAEYLNWTQVAPPRALIGQPGALSVIAPGAMTQQTSSAGTAVLVLTPTPVSLTLPPIITTTNGVTTFTQRGVTILTTTIGPPNGTSSDPAEQTTGGTIINGAVTQTSTLDNTFMSSSDFTSGGRFEFGRMDEDGRGWLVSGFNLGSQSQGLTASNVAVNFNNSPVGFADLQSLLLQYGTNGQIITDGVDDDLDHDGIYGRYGADMGTITTVALDNSTRLTEPLNGRPDFINNPPSVTTDYDDAAPLPTKFATLTVENRTLTYGVEAMRLWQVGLGPRGGVWEFFLGPRGISVNDQFFFDGVGITNTTTTTGTGTGSGSSGIAGTTFNTNAQNWLIGGQIGGRWSREFGRWQVGIESRALAAANIQHVTQQGEIGSLGAGIDPTGIINVQLPALFSHTVNQTEFAPGGEFRLNLKYHVFRSLYVQGGYTALYLNNIARGSRMNFYNLPDMGILAGQNKSDFFLHGFNFGLVLNR